MSDSALQHPYIHCIDALSPLGGVPSWKKIVTIQDPNSTVALNREQQMSDSETEDVPPQREVQVPYCGVCTLPYGLVA